MDITTMQLISTIFLVLSAVFLAVAVIYFFVQRIPQVIGDLSGKNAAREIGRIREHNESGTSAASKLSDGKKADVDALLSAKHMPEFLPEYDRTTNHLTGGGSGQMRDSLGETGDLAHAEPVQETSVLTTENPAYAYAGAEVMQETSVLTAENPAYAYAGAEIGATSVLGAEMPACEEADVEPVSYAEPEIGATSVLGAEIPAYAEPVSYGETYAEPEVGATSILSPAKVSQEEADSADAEEERKPEGFDVLMELDYTQSTEIIS